MNFETAIFYKKKGDSELNLGNHYQAWIHYTDALELLEKFYDLNENDGLRINSAICDSHQEAKIFSKRSVALLKMKQYYYAYEDAKQITDILPDWFKGYLRKADIESECGLYEESLKSYHLALRHLNLEKKEDHRNRYGNYINHSIKHQLFLMQRERIFNYQVIWIGTAIGLVVGMAFVSWDFVRNRNNSYINHPLMKLLIIGFCSFIFYYLTSTQRYFSRKHREKLLQPPHDKRKIE